MKRITLFICLLVSLGIFAQPLALDTSFTTGDFGSFPRVLKTVIMPGGKVLIIGNFSTYNGMAAKQIAMLNADGSLYTDFISSPGPSGGDIVDADIDDAGRIYLVGNFTHYNNVLRRGIVRLLGDGSVDPTFNPSSQLPVGTIPDLSAVAVRQDGKIFICGKYTTPVGSHLISFNLDGTPNGSFPSYYLGFASQASQIVFQPDNKVLVVGFPLGNAGGPLMRFNTDGSLDGQFSATNQLQGIGRSVLVRQDGKILIGGLLNKSIIDSTIFYLLCLNSDGSIDELFSTYGFTTNQQNGTQISDIVPFNNGYLLSGLIPSYSGVAQKNITYIDNNGNLISGFNLGTGFEYLVSALTDIDVSNGSLFVSGAFNSYNDINVRGIAKLSLSTLGTGNNHALSQPRIVSGTGSLTFYSEGYALRSIVIFDSLGRVVRSSNTIGAGFFEATGLDKGIYYCAIAATSGSYRLKAVVR